VYLPQDKVLFAGGLFFNEIIPYAGDGFITSWIRAMDTLHEMDIKTIIPGHGAIADKQGLRQAREYLFLMRDQAKTCFEKGLDEAQAEDQVQMDKYAHWPVQERTSANITRLCEEFRGEL
jgi:cyclase